MKKIVSLLTALFLLTGCVGSLQASQEDAFEVALDDSNVLSIEVSSYNIDEKKGKYYINFQTESGYYEYVIGNDGIIQSKEYTHGYVYSPESTDTNVVDETVKEEVKEEPNKEQHQENTATVSEVDKQRALQVACDNMGVDPAECANVSITKQGNTIIVKFDFNDGITRVTEVDANTFTAVSSYTV